MEHSVALEVHKHEKEDVYHDRARVPERFRDGLHEGRICKVSVAGKCTLLELRGIIGGEAQIIKLDDATRIKLGIDFTKTYNFTFREVWWWGQFAWAWNASDSTARIAARLGRIGVVLGLLASVIALVPLIMCP